MMGVRKEAPIRYINIIKDIYDGMVVDIKTADDNISEFSNIVGLH